jgi:homoserine O-acetyltransferase
MGGIPRYYWCYICIFVAATFLRIAPAYALPPVTESDWIAPEFRFADGQVLHDVKFHYLTLGTPKRDAAGAITNAVLLLHGTTNTGAEFLLPSLADELFGPGQPLDAARHYIIMPDGLGRGGSAKPSDGLKGRFPHYGYQDLVQGQYRLVTEGLGVKHLRLLLGVSMGGMNAWQWAERYPDMMDGLMPIACNPTQVSGRNFIMRRVVIEAIRQDPDWNNGEYTAQPRHFVYTLPMFTAMTQGVAALQQKAPTFKDGLAFYQSLVAKAREDIDANDYLYGMEASFDYDPEPGLASIKAKVSAVNFADDAWNPASLGIFEKLVARVPGARATVIPAGPGSNGHFSLLRASQWVSQLRELMESLPKE